MVQLSPPVSAWDPPWERAVLVGEQVPAGLEETLLGRAVEVHPEPAERRLGDDGLLVISQLDLVGLAGLDVEVVFRSVDVVQERHVVDLQGAAFGHEDQLLLLLESSDQEVSPIDRGFGVVHLNLDVAHIGLLLAF